MKQPTTSMSHHSLRWLFAVIVMVAALLAAVLSGCSDEEIAASAPSPQEA